METKKNYIDPTAGFFYGLGCSLVHLSMLGAMLFINYPDVEAAKKYDGQYLQLL